MRQAQLFFGALPTDAQPPPPPPAPAPPKASSSSKRAAPAAPSAKAAGKRPAAAAAATSREDHTAEAARLIFGHERFRPKQREAIDAILSDHDAFVLLPTGGGKSLCYQLPAVLSAGVTVVVSPLLALIQDQVTALTSSHGAEPLLAGVPATFLSSQARAGHNAAVLADLQHEKEPLTKLLYVTPEMLVANSTLRSVLQALSARKPRQIARGTLRAGEPPMPSGRVTSGRPSSPIPHGTAVSGPREWRRSCTSFPCCASRRRRGPLRQPVGARLSEGLQGAGRTVTRRDSHRGKLHSRGTQPPRRPTPTPRDTSRRSTPRVARPHPRQAEAAAAGADRRPHGDRDARVPGGRAQAAQAQTQHALHRDFVQPAQPLICGRTEGSGHP